MSTEKARRLSLVRHANAEQDSDVRDFERPLSRKGQGEALEMARRFQERGLVPDLILASAAVRTRETAEAFARILGVASRLLQADDSLYLKADDENRADFEALGLEPFVYAARDGSSIVMSYRQAPGDALESPQVMAEWARRGYAAALRAATRKRPSKPRAQRKATGRNPGGLTKA